MEQPREPQFYMNEEVLVHATGNKNREFYAVNKDVSCEVGGEDEGHNENGI